MFCTVIKLGSGLFPYNKTFKMPVVKKTRTRNVRNIEKEDTLQINVQICVTLEKALIILKDRLHKACKNIQMPFF